MLTEVVLRLWFAAEFARFISQQPRPSFEAATGAPGPEPMRVLVVGAGLGVGYGVQEARDSLSGQLANSLSADLGRGVEVDTRAEVAQPLSRTVSRLAGTDLEPYALVVYTPAFAEVSRGSRPSWRRRLLALSDAVQASGPTSPALIITGLPSPRVRRRIERLVTARAALTNRTMQAAVGVRTGFVEAPTYATPHGLQIFDHDYYRRFGEAVSRAARPLLATVA